MNHIRVDLLNMNNTWVKFEIVNVDTFIIRVRFGLTNVDTIRILTRHKYDPLTRITTPTSKQTCLYLKANCNKHRYFENTFPSFGNKNLKVVKKSKLGLGLDGPIHFHSLAGLSNSQSVKSKLGPPNPLT